MNVNEHFLDLQVVKVSRQELSPGQARVKIVYATDGRLYLCLYFDSNLLIHFLDIRSFSRCHVMGGVHHQAGGWRHDPVR